MIKKTLQENRKPTPSTDSLIWTEIQPDEVLAKHLHFKLFPELYDFMCDSISEAAQRRRGISPMSAEYNEKVRHRREQLGIPLSANAFETLEWIKQKLQTDGRSELETLIPTESYA